MYGEDMEVEREQKNDIEREREMDIHAPTRPRYISYWGTGAKRETQRGRPTLAVFMQSFLFKT